MIIPTRPDPGFAIVDAALRDHRAGPGSGGQRRAVSPRPEGMPGARHRPAFAAACLRLQPRRYPHHPARDRRGRPLHAPCAALPRLVAGVGAGHRRIVAHDQRRAHHFERRDHRGHACRGLFRQYARRGREVRHRASGAGRPGDPAALSGVQRRGRRARLLRAGRGVPPPRGLRARASHDGSTLRRHHRPRRESHRLRRLGVAGDGHDRPRDLCRRHAHRRRRALAAGAH